MNKDRAAKEFRVSYGDDFDERDELEAEVRGVLAGVEVFFDQKLYKLTFYSLDRFIEDTKIILDHDVINVVESGTVVIKGPISLNKIVSSVADMVDRGTFSRLPGKGS